MLLVAFANFFPSHELCAVILPQVQSAFISLVYMLIDSSSVRAHRSP